MQDAEHIRPLTALRFFAAAWVVLFHYWPNLVAAGEPMLVGKGYLGVELFFVLSGFILCHVYRTSVEEGRFRYGGFLWARLARVYPLHLATLVGLGALAAFASAAGMSIDQNILSWEALPANLLLVHAWGLAPVAGWNHPSWSISAEWFAYLTFPAFAWTVLKLKHRPAATLIGAMVFLAALYVGFQAVAGFPLTKATINWGALRIVPCFALGCALHNFWKARPAGDRSLALVGAAISLVAALSAASLGAPDALIVCALGFVILSFARLAQAGSNLLGQAPFVYLGEISYSVYMICIPWKIVFVNSIARMLQLNDERLPLWLWLVFILSVIPLAAASYHLVEKPARARMKLMAEAWATRRPSVAGA
ncbi:acyltransferase [Phenylobacterium sp.]|uniref:acyltransferase family protein n=1 Tax=Phenylobacterium sp. TaxID=1871053 RepID=UPI0027376557|nr:acyltransferase [Phenylobacterium sp.]MDP3659727.1 acyltransferase [Phenylobacterium sp.]